MTGTITPLQLWLAALLPTIFAIGTLAVSIAALLINNSRLTSIENRLAKIEEILGSLRERVSRLEMEHR